MSTFILLGILAGLWAVVGFVGFFLLVPQIAREYRDDIDLWKYDRADSEYIRDYKRYAAPAVIFMGPFGLWAVIKICQRYKQAWRPGKPV